MASFRIISNHLCGFVQSRIFWVSWAEADGHLDLYVLESRRSGSVDWPCREQGCWDSFIRELEDCNLCDSILEFEFRKNWVGELMCGRVDTQTQKIQIPIEVSGSELRNVLYYSERLDPKDREGMYLQI